MMRKIFRLERFVSVSALALIVACTSAIAEGKSYSLKDLRSSDEQSFSSFVTTKVDTSVFKKSQELDPAKILEEKKEPKIARQGSLADLRAGSELAMADFVRTAEKKPALHVEPKPERLEEKLVSDVASPEPKLELKKEEELPAPKPKQVESSIQIAVETSQGETKATTKTVLATETQPQQSVVMVKVAEKGVQFSLSSLKFLSKDDRYTVSLVDAKSLRPLKSSSEASVFVRDQSVVRYDPKSKTLSPLHDGSTELYVVSHGNAYFLPIRVEKEFDAPKLEMDKEFYSLEKSKPTGEHARLVSSNVQSPVVEENGYIVNPTAVPSDDFRVVNKVLNYTTLNLKIVDERSDLFRQRFYPAPYVRINLVGTKFFTYSDALGDAKIINIPYGQRLVLSINDDNGILRPAVVEVQANGKQQIITLMTENTYKFHETTAGAAMDANFGTVCGIVRDEPTKNLYREGISVSTGASAQGPFYFDRSGRINKKQTATGTDGRFCFFNVSPGPVDIHFYQGKDYLSTQLTAAYAKSFNTEDFYIYNPEPVTVQLGMFANAHQQLDADTKLANSLSVVDMVDMIPIGLDESMTYVDQGTVELENGLDFHNGRTFVTSQSSSFETMLFSLEPNSTDSSNVAGFYPAGFFDDMAQYAQVVRNPDLSSLVVEHNFVEGQKEGAEIRLIDEKGNSVGDGFIFADLPKTKAVFFNVPRGKYSVLVETREGYWLGGDTVYVVNEADSAIVTGSPIVRTDSISH